MVCVFIIILLLFYETTGIIENCACNFSIQEIQGFSCLHL